MKTMISSKGQVVLPAELRTQDRIRPGEQFEVERLASGQYLLKRLPTPGHAGVLDWLQACPEKDWFRPLPAQSTDQI
jgi:AbrB family looped-hinge helix DNA binding protein